MATAEAAGISMNRYWRIENGYADATEVERGALAHALDTTIENLFPLSDDESTPAASEVA